MVWSRRHSAEHGIEQVVLLGHGIIILRDITRSSRLQKLRLVGQVRRTGLYAICRRSEGPLWWDRSYRAGARGLGAIFHPVLPLTHPGADYHVQRHSGPRTRKQYGSLPDPRSCR